MSFWPRYSGTVFSNNLNGLHDRSVYHSRCELYIWSAQLAVFRLEFSGVPTYLSVMDPECHSHRNHLPLSLQSTQYQHALSTTLFHHSKDSLVVSANLRIVTISCRGSLLCALSFKYEALKHVAGGVGGVFGGFSIRCCCPKTESVYSVSTTCTLPLFTAHRN